MSIRNNKGLTLVELIIAFAIFAIVGIAISGFVAFCSSSYASSNKTTKLQYEQQMTVNRIRDIVLETSNGVSCGEDKLIVFSRFLNADGDVLYRISKIQLEDAASGDKKELKFGYVDKKPEDVEGLSVEDIASAITSSNLLSDTVTAFESEAKLNLKKEVKKITLKMTFKVGTKEIKVAPVIALRNTIANLSELGKIEEAYTEEEDIVPFSTIANVVIYRDGVAFKQSKTDTIAMADDDATTVKYDAVVTKKAAFTGSIDTSVTWRINKSSIKDEYQDTFQNWISIDADGKVSLRCQTVDGEKITPNQVINGDYFTITATSVEDPSVSASLRIKITTGGVYPSSIDTEEPIQCEVDANNEQATYLCKHIITFTDGSELRDDDAYPRIKYVSVTPDNAEGAIPAGAGFTVTGAVNGKFLVTPSMQGHTYHIRVEVTQKNRYGEVVFDEFDITVPEDLIPDLKDITVPSLNCPDSVQRGAINALYATWSKGAPTYIGSVTDTHSVTTEGVKIKYYYWYEFELTDNDNACANWGNDTRNKFSSIITSSSSGTTRIEDGKVYVVTGKDQPYCQIKCEPYLDWEKSFTYKVTLRVRVSKVNDFNTSLYYVPGGDGTDESKITTTEKGLAYSSSQVVKIDPVTLTLTPVDDPKTVYNNSPISDTSIVNKSNTIGIGNRIKGKNNADLDNYYKYFSPQFTGISINSNNYTSNFDPWHNGIWVQYWNPDTNAWQNTEFVTDSSEPVAPAETTVQLHYWSSGEVIYKNVEYGYSQGFILNEKVDNQLYAYLRVWPRNWVTNTDQLPYDLKWTYIAYDNKGNRVKARFANASGGTNEYMIYNLVNKYEEDYEAQD